MQLDDFIVVYVCGSKAKAHMDASVEQECWQCYEQVCQTAVELPPITDAEVEAMLAALLDKLPEHPLDTDTRKFSRSMPEVIDCLRKALVTQDARDNAVFFFRAMCLDPDFDGTAFEADTLRQFVGHMAEVAVRINTMLFYANAAYIVKHGTLLSTGTMRAAGVGVEYDEFMQDNWGRTAVMIMAQYLYVTRALPIHA